MVVQNSVSQIRLEIQRKMKWVALKLILRRAFLIQILRRVVLIQKV